MIQYSMCQNKQLVSLGAVCPKIILHIDNQPLLPEAEATAGQLTVPAVTAVNGNHWRKVFTVFAKLAAPYADDWKQYRDTELLSGQEAIHFGQPVAHEAVILVAGKASWQRLGLDVQGMQAIGSGGGLYAQENLLCTPYFDYRQFPNAMIAEAREWLVGQVSLADAVE